MSWIVPELGTFFSTSFEEMLINYIYAKWSFTTGELAKPAAMQTDTAPISFRVGEPNYKRPYEIVAVTSAMQPRESSQAGSNKRLQMQAIVPVGARMKRIQRDRADPQLSLMEFELLRIIGQYRQIDQTSGDLLGIKNMLYGGMERINNATDNYATSDWRSMTQVALLFEVVDSST